jgi:uncharacterized protein
LLIAESFLIADCSGELKERSTYMRRYLLTIILAIVALMVVIVTGPAVRLYTDLLWFRSLGYGTIFSTILITRVSIGLLLGVIFFALVYGNLWYARRIAPVSPVSMDNELLERGFRIARRALGLLFFIGSMVVAALVGLEAATHWEKWLAFFNPTLFGSADPVFNRDIGFYVFRLPSFLPSWCQPLPRLPCTIPAGRSWRLATGWRLCPGPRLT